MCAAVLLRHALTKDVLDVVLAQRRLELALAGRVDTLADDNRLRADLDCLRERRNHRSVLGNRRGERLFAAYLDHFTDVCRCRAAAAAERVHAHAGNLSHESRKLLCVDIEYRRAVFAARQTGIRIDNDRKRGNLGQALDDRLHLYRAKAAVDAERVYAQTFEHGNDRIHRAAGKQLALFIKNSGDNHRQIAAFLSCEHRCLGLVAVAHGLDQNKVGACRRTDANGLGKQLDRPLERQIAHRLEQLAGRSDVERNKSLLAPCKAARGLCMVHRRLDDLAQVVRILERIRAEGIGVDDITACLKIAAVQRDDLIRMRQVPRFGQLSGLQSVRLQDRAHAAVKKHPFFS